MILSDLANFAEIVSAIGVVGSLIFLAVEIRKNTTATTRQSYHSIVTRRAVLFRESMSENRESAEIFAKGLAAGDLDTIDAQRFLGGMLNWMSHFQDVYMQFRSGIVEEDVWDAERRFIAAMSGQPGFRNWWREANQYYLPDFIEEVSRVKPLNLVSYDPDTHDWSRPAGLYLDKGSPADSKGNSGGSAA